MRGPGWQQSFQVGGIIGEHGRKEKHCGLHVCTNDPAPHAGCGTLAGHLGLSDAWLWTAAGAEDAERPVDARPAPRALP